MMNSDKRPYPTLPQQRTTFVGRDNEIARLSQLLADPACQLITLLGPGGVGKTQLAQVMAKATSFADGVYFVPLQPVPAATAVLPTIADSLRLQLGTDNPPLAQLTQFLQDKSILIILDNLEHLLACADELADLLAAAPSLKLLVTSREVLNLQEEWQFLLAGLPVPDAAATDTLDKYGAVALFCQRARQVQPDFSLAAEQTAVIEICRLVGGLPLALELAAAWTKTMTCAAIAAEMQNNLHFLSSRLRNVPERHRSVRAVFTQSWQMLTAEAQQTFARLSLFRGGFRREAAEPIAGASLDMLSEFVDKSLLVWQANGRYQMHELLRQFAAEELSHLPTELIQTFHAHCTYYTTILQQRSSGLYGDNQVETATAIEADLDNIRAALTWAVAHKRLADLRHMVTPLGYYYQLRGRYLAGMQTLEMMLVGLDEATLIAQEIRVSLLVGLAWYALRFGQISRAQDLAEQCLTIYEQTELSFPIPHNPTNDPALILGIVATICGDYETAERFCQQALQRSQTPETFYGNQQTAYYQLASIASLRGNFAAAQIYAQAAFTAAEKVQDCWFMAYCHLELGNIAQQLGETAVAQQHFQASYNLREPLGDAEGMAVALTRLGEMALHESDPTAAQKFSKRSIALYQKVPDPGGRAAAYLVAARAAMAQHDGRSASVFLSDALAIANEIAFVTLTLSLLVEVGTLLADNGRSDPASTIFATIAHHPAAPHDVQVRVQASDAPPAELPTIVALAQQALASLATEMEKATAVAPNVMLTNSTIQQANQALIEPLTPRELEILQLIAEGLTNREIAECLVVVIGTIKAHTNKLYGKLGVGNRTQAVAHARKLGLV